MVRGVSKEEATVARHVGFEKHIGDVNCVEVRIGELSRHFLKLKHGFRSSCEERLEAMTGDTYHCPGPGTRSVGKQAERQD